MTASRQERHRAGRYPAVNAAGRRHTPAECERELEARPDFDRMRCTPRVHNCSCGRRWVHVCDEAEGCGYYESPAPLDIDTTDRGTRELVSRMVMLDPPVSPQEDEAWREMEST